MSPDTAWKQFERTIATDLHTLRTPLSGGAGRITRSDTLHPDLYIECKDTLRQPVVDLFNETRTRAVLENKVPVLALHRKHHAGSVAVVSWPTFVILWKSWQQTHPGVTQPKQE